MNHKFISGRWWLVASFLSILTVLSGVNYHQYIRPFGGLATIFDFVAPVLTAVAVFRILFPDSRVTPLTVVTLYACLCSVFGSLFGTAAASPYWNGTFQVLQVPLVGPLLNGLLLLLCVGGSFTLLFILYGTAQRRYPGWAVYGAMAVLTPVVSFAGYFVYGLRP